MYEKIQANNQKVNDFWNEVHDSEPMNAMLDAVKTPEELERLAKLGLSKDGKGILMKMGDAKKTVQKNNAIKQEYIERKSIKNKNTEMNGINYDPEISNRKKDDDLIIKPK